MSLVWQNLFISSFFWCSVAAGSVHIDFSKDQCIGCTGKIRQQELKQHVVSNNNTHCLRRCALLRAKYAVYRPGRFCHCATNYNLDTNRMCCVRGYETDVFKVYNLTGVVLQFTIPKFIEQNEIVAFKPQILLRQKSGREGDRIGTSEKLLAGYNCTFTIHSTSVLPAKRSVSNASCTVEFKLDTLGVNWICIGFRDSEERGCVKVRVLARVKMKVTKLQQGVNTDPKQITFKVELSGSVFNISYDFGNRQGVVSQRFQEPIIYRICQFTLRLQHNYTSPGDYNFTIRASNPLNEINITRSLLVKLRISIHLVSVVWNRNNFTAYLKASHDPVGRKLRYRWLPERCKNGSFEPNDMFDPYVTFSAREPCQIIVVVLTEDGVEVGRKHKRRPVDNQQFTIRVHSPFILKGNVTTFHAGHYRAGIYRWYINGISIFNGTKTFSHTFEKVGSYSVSVSTGDLLSGKLNVIVEDKIREISIDSWSSSVVGLLVNFRAHVVPARGITFEWDFGDGGSRKTLNSTTSNNYDGKQIIYEVKVTARNNVSNKTASKNVNVTSVCPKFEAETSFQNKKEVEHFRSLPIHLEVGMKTFKCVKPVSLKYIWKVQILKSGSSGWSDVELDNQDFNKTTLGIYIPSNTLNYAKYRFEVKVVVALVSDREIKHIEEFSTIYKITKTPLKAIIRGGFVRYISNRTESITMDASMSFDPDNPGNDIQFTWSCRSKKFNSSCFKSGYTIKSSYSIIRDIPLSKFSDDSSPFVFTVGVTNEIGSIGRSAQMLYIKGGDFNNMLLDCPSCNEGFLNPSKPVVILRKCAKCTNKEKLSWVFTQYLSQTGYMTALEFKGTGCRKLKIDGGLGIQGKNSSIIHRTYEQCGGNSSSARYNEEKDTICKIFDETFCEASFGVQRELPKSHARYGPYSAILGIKKRILPSKTILKIDNYDSKNADGSREPLASRYFIVQDSPLPTDCTVHPTTGVELHNNFHVTCASRNDHESHLLTYKIVFKRENDNSGKHDGKRQDIIFQGSLRFMIFQLPSGNINTVKYSLELSIMNENGVARKYCPMNLHVSPLDPGTDVTIEEFLYNRSVTVKEMFHGHKYAYHAQTLHSVTIIAEVLNRQPKVSKHTSKFHLRAETRVVLIDILSGIEVFGEYATSQFADSFESCTRVPEELNYASTVSAIDALNRVFEKGEKIFLEQRTSILDDYLMDNVIDAADMLLTKTNELGENQHDKKVVQSLEYLFKAKLNSMIEDKEFVLEKNSFNATLLKVYPYDNGTVAMTHDDAHLALSLKGRDFVAKTYFCDVYGYGVQVVTLNTKHSDLNNISIHKTSPTAKLTTYDCQGKVVDLVNLMEVKIKLPRETFQNPVSKPAVIHAITPGESHQFVVDGSINNALEIELLPLSLMSPKLKIRLNLTCVDTMKDYEYYSGNVTYSNPLKKSFSRKVIKNCDGKLSIVITTYWIVPPHRMELVNPVVNYTMMIRWTTCLSKDNTMKEWTENYCNVEGVPGHYFVCSCPKIPPLLVAVTKTASHSFEKTPITRETNSMMRTVILVLSAIYVSAFIFLYIVERQEQIRKKSFIVLTPSDPSHTHEYQVTVYTGHASGAGTTAKVALILYGEQNSSYPVELSIENYSLFRRNSRDNFIVSVREKLGPLRGIHLWHDGGGSSPSWFVEKIILKDLVSEEKWMFKCCRWLAADKHNKKLDCKIKLCEAKPQLNFQEFRFEFGKKMMDINVWLSLVGMPSYSLFRRTERLTCCLLMVFGYLFLNAFFYHNRNDVLTMDCISVLNPMWAQFEIGILSALIVIPVNLLFTVMFRFTKPTETRRVTPSSPVKSTPSSKGPSMSNFLSLERCASVLRDFHHRSKRHPRSNQVTPQQVVFPSEDIFPAARNATSTIVTFGSSTDVSVVDRIIDHEITSQGSGSYMYYRDSEKFRFPGCFSILMWIGCITTYALAAHFTLEYTYWFDPTTLICYAQSVCWSLFLSFFIFQPFEAMIVTLAGMLRRKYIYYDAYIEDPVEDSERGGKPVMITDRMDWSTGTQDETSEEAAYYKSLYLKYLQPLSKKELCRVRISQEKKNEALGIARDLLLYSFLLILLYLMTSYTDQQSIFLHNQKLKHGLTRQENSSSFRLWWSSGPQRLLETLKYDNFSGVITALGGRTMIIGNPKVVTTIKYCKDVSKEEMSYPYWHCSPHEEHRTMAFDKSRKNNWMELSDYVYQQLTQHVKALSLDFVIYTPALNLFSTLRWSTKVLLSSNLLSDVAVKTIWFSVDDSSGTSVYTIYQILFTLVPVLLIVRQVHSVVQMKKISVIIQVVELSIVILAMLSCTVMWMWIKSQYLAMALLRHMFFYTDLTDSADTIYNYQENLRSILGILQFLVLLKVCHLVVLQEFLASYGVTFAKTLRLVLFPLFSLLVVFTAFAHTGLLLFGDYVESFSTFIKALSLNIIYLKEIGTVNIFLENRNENVLLVFYVIGFCVCVGFVSCLIKAAFCQAHLYNILSEKNDKLFVKTTLIRIAKRFLSLVIPYIDKCTKGRQANKPVVPMRYVLKEVNEKLDEMQFRLVNLFSNANMPPKTTAFDESSSYQYNDEEMEVEYVYRMEDDVPLCHSPGLSTDGSDSAANDSAVVVPLECRSVESLDDGYGDNCAENLTLVEHETLENKSNCKPEIDAVVSMPQFRLFERATPVFPRPISMPTNPTGRPTFHLNAFTEENARPDVDQNSGSDTNVMPGSAAGNEKPVPVEHSRKFRSPVFPLPIDTFLSRSSRVENSNTELDYSELEVSEI